MKDWVALCKPRITLLVVATAAFGWEMAGGTGALRLACLLIGTGLASCAAGAWNQALEGDVDALMTRTRHRPVASGRVRARDAALFGAGCAAAGLALNAWAGNALACGLTALTLALYAGFYTPLKRVTPHSTWFGAAAGAMPPLIGWAAARGDLSLGAWVIFAIQFLWQIPHFLALFWLYRDDYARAGFKVMPVVDPSGGTTACQIALHSFAVLPITLLPGLCGMLRPGYMIGALCLGTGYLMLGMRASWTLAARDTRRLFFASLAYLPLIFGMMAFGGA